MTAKDKYGHIKIYEDLIKEGRPEKDDDYLIEYHYEEEDGWSFMGGNVNREIAVTFSRKIPSSKLEKLIENAKLDPKAIKLMRKMAKKGITSKKFLDSD